MTQANLPNPNDATDDIGLTGWMSHLVELRSRLAKAALAVLLVFAVLLYWSNDIFGMFAKPMLDNLPAGSRMISTEVTSNFFVPLKFVLWVAFTIALPIVLHQIWAFVAPGLYTCEKKLVLPIIASSYILFLIGTAFAYFLVFPTVFKFMANLTPLGVEMATDIDAYLSFGLTTFLAFGLTFEVPVVVIVLVRLGFVTIEQLKIARPYVIVGAFVIAAIITPPDIASQLLLAIPLVILYEVGLQLARWAQPATDESSNREFTKD
ncbi:Sec-independent protein translocase protein TatC [Formosimonas limnophila]|uniref:Sec-independent protein translocase protein TatC n=1 Tax=Formosimonas limnophila TaxID=1384487 RepID=A0A8J3CMR6_9BURK|nr:twin-arginine translocase subunit TatC [Formosimonas limnophila]GHA71850.1 Sec-independent protein translocase protein TatC [Formosimonas limnophila]